MFEPVKLPKLTEDMTEAVVIECLVKVGDKVSKGDVIFNIETDKAVVEMESHAAGFVKAVTVNPDETISLGDVMLVLGSEDEELTGRALADIVKDNKAQADSDTQEKHEKPAKAPSITSALSDIKNPGASEYKLGDKVPVNRLGKITAEKMVRSKRDVPCFYLNVTVDAGPMVEFRKSINEKSDVKISYNDIVMKAVAEGIEQYPIMSGRLEGDYIVTAESIGAGLAISTPAGLVAPVVKDLGNKSVEQIAVSSRDLAECARAGELVPEDFTGACITISNLGAYGIDSFVPIVVPGQCSILGIGQIAEVCVSSRDGIKSQTQMKMTLSVDHRIANGAEAARFLDCVAKRLEALASE